MTDPLIPRTDADALLWLESFSANINGNLAAYQLQAADGLAIQSAVQSFASALAASSNDATRTPAAVNLKDQTRNSAEQICRQYAILIKYNAGISDQAKIDAGVRPVNPDRNPVPQPATSPLLDIIAATPGVHTVRYSDSMTPDSRAKPNGSSDLLLFVAVADSNQTDPANASFVGKFTKNPIAVTFDAADNGKQATYFARWSNRKGQMGPWSIGVSLAIAA